MPFARVWGGRAAATILTLLVGACAPTLDWREVRPEGSGAVALLPCKPANESRTVELAGARIRMQISACSVAGTTWALAHADVEAAERVSPALAALRDAAAKNLGGAAAVVAPMKVPGMTPNTQAERLHVDGRLPGGETVGMDSGFFVKGTRVYQATAMGKAIPPEAVATFFDNLKLPT